ncbi:MAG: integrin alpha [Myxococcota bacterium]|nr:integrin alpha [Myxococcota bacterium]
MASGDFDGDGLDDILVGASGTHVGSYYYAGVAYIILAKSLGSTSEIDLSTADHLLYGGSGEGAAISLAGAGDVDGDGRDDIIVGATGMSNGGVNAGGAYLVMSASLGSSSSFDLSSSADYEFLGEGTSDDAGYSVASAGDVDADGLDDVIVGARSEDSAASGAGSAYIILGSSLGSSSSIDLSLADYQLTGEAKHDSAGYSVAGAGDVNGDGRDDVIVSSRNNSNGGYNSGTAYVVLGSSLGSTSSISLSSTYKLIGEAAYDTAGESVASAGDVDGDGLDDVLVGSQNNDDGGSSAGKAYVILGASLSGSIDLSDADIQLAGENSWDYAGVSVASAGDVNGDGFDGILVGAYLNGDGGGSAGKAYLFLP